MITGTQIRAARALLGWSQAELAERSEASLPTIKRFEASGNDPAGTVKTNERLRLAVEVAGIVFINDDAEGGRGVRMGRRDRTPKSPGPKGAG